jgi:hypothetical protein
MAMDDKIIDKRVIKRSIKKGLVTQEAVQDYLRALPDKSGQIESAPSGEPLERGTSGG